jgi:DNA-directed RNA polymerase subunit alpha
MRKDEVMAAAAAAEPEFTMPDIPDDSDPEVLSTPISDLDLSVRSSKCMAQLDVNTIGELCQLSETELLQMKNFGQTSLQEIKNKLAKLGLGLRA